MPRANNGWRDGRDPIQRWLRIVTTITMVVVSVILAVDPSRRDFPTLVLITGIVMVFLGYEGLGPSFKKLVDIVGKISGRKD